MMRDQLHPRLAAKIEPDANGCWVWTRALDYKGYARVFWDGKNVSAHRLIYTMLAGEIPEGLQLDHLCRNRPCVNPQHLEPVTGAENCLRGESPTAVNARKTHCHKGHPFSGDNLWVQVWRGSTMRRCRTCMRNRSKSTTSQNGAVS